MNKNPLLNLIDKKLSAVVFVLDYLQIQFDGFILTFLDYPKVEVDKSIYSFGENGYRNKICEFIGKSVSAVNYVEDEIFSLSFDSGKIYCSINPESYRSPEMIIFDDGNGNTIVI